MTRVIAAITDDAAAKAVLSTSGAIARLFSADAEALHVGEEKAAVASAAREASVPLRTVAGDAVQQLAGAAAAADVAAVVIGARGTPAGKRPAGNIAIALVESVDKPVVVVPPDATVARPVESVLVALDGTAGGAAALNEIIELATNAELEIVVAHVLSEQSLPAFSDHLPHEVRAWSEEFIARYCPAALDARLELRVGEPQEHICDILRASGCHLVALGWSQNLGGGRAAVVRRMLAQSPVPVLLTPASRDAFSPRFAGAATPAKVPGEREAPTGTETVSATK